MKNLNFLSKLGGQAGSERGLTLASTVGSQEEFYVSGGNSRGAFTPADVCQTSSVRLNRFTAHRRGTMLKLLSVLVLIFTFGCGQMWGNTTINAGDVVSGTSYAKYSTSDWIITFGGNNSSVGTNSNNRSKCNLSNYSKYAVSPVTTSNVASAFVSLSSLSNINKVSYTFSGGSNQTSTNVYLIYSSNGTTFSQKLLTKGTQGHTISSGTELEFAKSTGYFGLLFKATNSSGNWRIDGVSITFYEATGGTTYTVTYNLNGGTGTTPTEAAKAKDATFSLHNGTTSITAPSGKIFSQWKDQDNNYFNGGATYTMPAKNVTLTAQWVDAYTVTYNLNGGTGTTPTESKKAASSTFTLHDGTTGITAPTNKEFSKWKDQDGNEYDASDPYTMPAKNVTLTAQWVRKSDYVLVENANDIAPGQYLIVYNNTNALNSHYGNVNTDTYATYTNISSYYSNKKIASNATTNGLAYTVEETTNGYSISKVKNSTTYYLGYNNATTGGNNGAYLRWDDSFSTNTSRNEWTLGVGSIVSVYNNSKAIRWNTSSPRFAIYGTTGQSAIQLFKKEPTTATLKFDLNGKTTTETKPSNITGVELDVAYTLPSTTLTTTGYTFVGWNTNKNATTKLTEITPTEPTTITLYAIWTPNTNTAYTVKHYKQQLDGTYSATPDDTDNETGTTGASVTPAVKSYTGFSAPNTQTTAILADGSLVVSYQYTRNSYTLTWSTDGDALTGNYTSGSTKFGAPITAPNTPTKTGYVFDAWSPTPASTMPAEAKTYTATWTCKTPEIETDLNTAQVDYIKDVTATALLISASANGASLNYAWEKSANGTTGWSHVGTNSSSYTPSTAEEGDLYYRCIVTNAVAEGCSSATATSKVAHIHVVAPSVCLTPSFSPATDTYVGSQNVEISSTAGATIYYTTDGSDPKTSGTRSTYSSAIEVNETTTIRAYAEKAEMTASEEGSATITIKCADPTFSPAGGSFTSAQNVSLATEYGDEIYYTTDGSDPATNGTKYTSAIAVSTTNTTIKAVAKKENCANSDLATATYTIACATPTFSPEAGTYTGTQNVTISSTDGATIYYTTDGTTPDNTKSVYSSAIPVSANTTIKAIAVKDGLSQSAIGSATYSIKYTVTLNAGTGSVSDGSWTESEGVWTKAQTAVGGSITLPNAASGVSGWNFSGWKTGSAVTTQTDVKPDYVATTYTPTSDITLYAVYEKTSGGSKVDEITRDFIGVTSSSYTAWSGKSGSASNAVYAGKSAGGDAQSGDAIQLRSKDSDCGIITTTSGGKAMKVTVTWNDYTADTRTLDIYGKGTAYSAATDLYSSTASTQGTKLGSIVNGTSTELTITGDYEYIGMRSNSGAMYFDEIDIEWSTASYSYYSNPSDKVTLTYDVNGAAGEAPSAQGNITIGTGVTVAAKPDGLAKTGYDFGGWNTKADGTGTNYTAGTGEITMTDNITLYAKWTKHDYTVAVADVDHTIITATPQGGSAIAEKANAAVAYEKEVSLAKTDDEHFTVAWDVYETGNSDNKVSVSENTFTVPAFDVTVSATITEDAKRNVKFYSNGSQLGTTQEVYVGEAPVAETAVYESCLEGSNMFYGWATEEWTGAIASTAGKTVYTSTLPNVEAGEGDVNYYAVWAKGTSTPTTSYAKITSGLEEDNYVIAYSYNNGEQIVLKNEEHANPVDGKLAGFSLALSESKYSNPGNAYIWTLQAQNDGSYYIYNAAIEKYVNATTAATLSATPTKFTLDYNTTDSRWIIKLASNTDYAFHGYVTSSNNTITDRDFRVSTSPISHNNASKYRIYLYKNEKETSYSEFRTNCCALKPVTGLTAGTVAATSITLNWNAPESTDGITKLQVVNADNGNVLKDNIDKDATSAVVTGLETCTTYNLKVVSVGDDCSSNSNIVTATPQEAAKTVTFQYNDGATADLVESTTCEANYVAVPANPTRSGYRFMGWKNGDELVEGETFTPTAASTTINATWTQLFTVHYDFAGATTGVAPDDAQYIAGEEVTLTDVEPSKGFLAPFKAWSFSPSVEVSEGKFAMPAENVTITATYDEIIGQWILVTDESTLNEGDYVVIAAAGSNKAMKTTQNSTSYRYITDITKSGNTISTPSNDVQIFVLEEGTVADSWAFKCLNGEYKDKYIYANSSSSNTINTKATKDDDGSWILDFVKGYATAQGTNTHNILSFNSDRFACYGNTNQSSIAFYQFREGTFYDVTLPEEVTGGSVSANTSMAKAGETVTLTYAPSRGYTVETLTVTGTSGSIEITPAVEAGVTEYTFTMPAEAVTVAASFEEVDPVEYHMVENASDIPMGMQFVMLGTKADGSEPYVIGEMNNSNRLAGDAVESSAIDAVNKTLSLTTEAAVDFTMEGENGAFKIMYNNKYLEARSGNTVAWSNTGNTWAIAISEGKATITSGDYKLNYNPSQNWVAAYTTAQQPVTLYALPYTTYNFVLDGCRTIKVVTGYTYTYTIKNSDEPSSTPGDNYTFLHKWTDGTNTYAVGDEVTVSAAKTLQPCWKVTTPEEEDVTDIDGLPESVTEIVVNKDKNLNVNDDRTINTLTIKSASGAFEVDGSSGQVTGGSTLTVTDNLFLEIKLCDGDMDAEASRKWYCIAAPFDVAINGGFFWGDGTPMVLNTHFQLFEWDGDRRATGASGWRRTSSNLKAHTAYFIGFDDERENQNTIKLKAMSNTISNAAKIVAPEHTGSADADTYGNWNGLANPNFHHIALNKNVQAFDYNEQHYNPYATGAYNFVVGTPFFIQYAGNIGIEAATNANYRAPKREDENYSYCVRIGSAEASHADNQIYVRASETASAELDNERDMITMNGTTSNYGALLWTENYGGKRLAIEEAPLVNGTASYVLTLSAPQAGTYSISVAAPQENADLYLTYEGSIIWNLSEGAYTMDLNKGITNGYGLILRANAPSAATGIDEAESGKQKAESVQKIILDEKVFILRGGKMYDVTGKAVK